MAVETKRSVHVLNLPVYPLCEIEDLLFELFLQVGPVSKVFIPYNKEDGVHKGYGFVEFLHEESVPYACKMLHGTKLMGLYIGVNPAVSKAEKEHIATIQMEEETPTDNPTSNDPVETPSLLDDHSPKPPPTSVSVFATPTMVTPPSQPGLFCPPPFLPPQFMTNLPIPPFPPPPIPPSFPPPPIPPSFSSPPMTLPTPPLPQATPTQPQFFANPHSFMFNNSVVTPPPTTIAPLCDVDTMTSDNSNNNRGYTDIPSNHSGIVSNQVVEQIDLDFSNNPFKLAAEILAKSRTVDQEQSFNDSSLAAKRLEGRGNWSQTMPPPIWPFKDTENFSHDVIPRGFNTSGTEEFSFIPRRNSTEVFEYNHQSILDSPAPS